MRDGGLDHPSVERPRAGQVEDVTLADSPHLRAANIRPTPLVVREACRDADHRVEVAHHSDVELRDEITEALESHLCLTTSGEHDLVELVVHPSPTAELPRLVPRRSTGRVVHPVVAGLTSADPRSGARACPTLTSEEITVDTLADDVGDGGLRCGDEDVEEKVVTDAVDVIPREGLGDASSEGLLALDALDAL